MTMPLIVAAFALALVIGGALGYMMRYATERSRLQAKREQDAHDETSQIPSAFDVQLSMVQSACQETKGQNERERQAIIRSAKIAERAIERINKQIARQAARRSTSAHVAIKCDDDRKDDGMFADSIINADEDTMGHVGRMLSDAYASHGFDTDSAIDADWRGNIFVSLYIRWNRDFDASLLDRIEFPSQVEAFKEGVPLEDILA